MSNFMDSLGIYWYKINEKTGERTKIPFEMTDSEDSDDFTDKDEVNG